MVELFYLLGFFAQLGFEIVHQTIDFNWVCGQRQIFALYLLLQLAYLLDIPF
jgi:hypothetical protein